MLVKADARRIPLQNESVQCVVTSPPYWGLRKYAGEQEVVWPAVPSRPEDEKRCPVFRGGEHGWEHEWVFKRYYTEQSAASETGEAFSVAGADNAARLKAARWRESNICSRCGAWRGAFGLEPTIEMYVAHTVEILREVRRVLRSDGVCFWNVGDSYASGKGTCHNPGGGRNSLTGHLALKEGQAYPLNRGNKSDLDAQGLKPKDLCLIPSRIALAAQADGWWVRSMIIWAKPNPMPESCTDRPTDAYEHILMLTKSARYFWDADAVSEPVSEGTHLRLSQNVAEQIGSERAHGGAKTNGNMKAVGRGGVNPKAAANAAGSGIKQNESFSASVCLPVATRNMRNVWNFPTQPYKGAHFATFPEELPRRCILAATSERGACVQCGAPWERVCRLTPEYAAILASGKAWTDNSGEPDEYTNRQPSDHPSNLPRKNNTIGFRPTCVCRGQHRKTRPCVVLDLFGGSGTTGRVAIELGRTPVLLDIAYGKGGYSELADARTRNVQRPLGLI